MGRMIKENEAALQNAIARDLKTASQEYIFETADAAYWATKAALRASRHIGQGAGDSATVGTNVDSHLWRAGRSPGGYPDD